MKTLAKLAMWGLVFCFPAGAIAQDREPALEVGVGLICNSESQVERYLALHIADRSPDAAVKLVNEEVKDPNACTLASIAFLRGSQGKQVSAPGGVMKITEVTIVATQTTEGNWEPIVPIVQFTAIYEKLEAV